MVPRGQREDRAGPRLRTNSPEGSSRGQSRSHFALFASWREVKEFHAKLAKSAKGLGVGSDVRAQEHHPSFAFFAPWREVDRFHAKPAKFAKPEASDCFQERKILAFYSGLA